MFADSMFGAQPLIAAAAIGCATCAAAILVWYLARRPPLDGTVRVVLLFGFGVFPIGTALTANVVSFEHMKRREFCGSCHVMEPYTENAADTHSTTLPAIHSRNELFGNETCYQCHSDYGMFGPVVTKLNGAMHLYHYLLEYRTLTIAEALPKIHLYQPFPNTNCTRCHSTGTPRWNAVPEHEASERITRDGEVSCASAGCHGPAHPFSKDDQALAIGGAR